MENPAAAEDTASNFEAFTDWTSMGKDREISSNKKGAICMKKVGSSGLQSLVHGPVGSQEIIASTRGGMRS